MNQKQSSSSALSVDIPGEIMIDLINLSSSNSFKIIVKPNFSKNKLLGFDEGRQAYRVEIKAKPESGKANLEVVKFFSKLIKKDVKIIKGMTSKEKILKIK